MDIRDIKVLQPGEYHIEHLDIAFVILGYLHSYLKSDEDPTDYALAYFYPAEAALAERFEGYLRRFQSERGITTTVTRDIKATGHIALSSPELTRAIYSYYTVDAGVSEIVFPRKKWGGLGRYELGVDDRRASYLLGIHERYGKGHVLDLSSRHTAEIVMALLEDLGCRYLDVKMWLLTVPNHFKIEFEPSVALRRFFSEHGAITS